ncbi:cobalamin biosynthesis protein CobD/CbiB [Pseudobutyrivibrio xylanivorans]|uniref:Adenosylcobinamide-phosphate synthase n=1 Tax=Pseudobutyrivibrio xylanivorans TaxID=185007 RepID=A0A1G5RYW9_PSEXY|nr:cobalamin biosynthesis protein [Pseudobutyrivibrio xylanivorans]SCZ79302.1 adenosylcobinamide-phosphate synthase [Pseudobutyrivibrio xylanivorans]
MFKLHIFALLLGTILDFIIGPLYTVWNPFDSIGRWIKFLDRALLGDEIILLEDSKQKSLGLWMLFLVLLPVVAVVSFFVILGYEIAPFVGVIIEAITTYFCLEANRLFYLGREVMNSYYGDGIPAMRHALELLTGGDVEEDDEESLTARAVTYIANEAGDSVVSPLFVMFLFGPVGGFIYRTVDLMDARLGHKNKRYNVFGFYTAKFNQIIDWLPGRISGVLAVFAARYTFGDFHGKNARYIHLRDRYKAISAFAGAIGIRLKDESIGDADRVAEPKDIRTATALMRNMFLTCQLILVILLLFF